MRAVSRRNIIAVVVGGLLAGIPLFAFNYWLEGLIDRQGEVEVGPAAKRAIALPRPASEIRSAHSTIWRAVG